MTNTSDPTFPYRLAAGVAFFFCLAVWDFARHRGKARRWREYVFLFAAAGVAMLYGILHDFATWSISPGYFVYGKGVSEAADGYGWPMMKLAMSATWTVGLLTAAGFLMANNPDAQGRTLSYRRLWRYGLVVLGASLLFEILLGVGFVLNSEIISQWAAGSSPPTFLDSSFVLVWGMHAGAYLGALLGALTAILLIWRHKKALPCEEL